MQIGNAWASALLYHSLIGVINCKTPLMQREKPDSLAVGGSVTHVVLYFRTLAIEWAGRNADGNLVTTVSLGLGLSCDRWCDPLSRALAVMWMGVFWHRRAQE